MDGWSRGGTCNRLLNERVARGALTRAVRPKAVRAGLASMTREGCSGRQRRSWL